MSPSGRCQRRRCSRCFDKKTMRTRGGWVVGGKVPLKTKSELDRTACPNAVLPSPKFLPSSWSPGPHASGHSPALGADASHCGQAVSFLDVSPGQVVSLLIFGVAIQDADGISTCFGSEAIQVSNPRYVQTPGCQQAVASRRVAVPGFHSALSLYTGRPSVPEELRRVDSIEEFSSRRFPVVIVNVRGMNREV